MLAIASDPASTLSSQAAPARCVGAADCRAETDAAIAQGDFERAHDLAWRTLQQGPHDDPGLMYLLAQAQALSGRPDDALVMIRRLVERGITIDASTAEFRRTRDLAGWPAVAALIAAGPSAAAPPATRALPMRSPVVAPIPPPLVTPIPSPVVPPTSRPVRATVSPSVRAVAPEAAARADALESATVEAAGHFASREFAPGGLACDAVSRRFVFGDRPGRQLQIVAEGGTESIDLTRAASAGFLEVVALDIDTTRGDLWVVSAASDGRTAMLHKLQLVSGRALASYHVPVGADAVQLVDVAVTMSGTVLLVDAQRRTLLELRPGASAVEVLADLRYEAPSSLTTGGRDGVAYVAHRDGISRVDLGSGAVTPLTGPIGTSLGAIERLRRQATSLVGIQAMPDGSRRLVHLALNPAGRAVTSLRVIDMPLPSGAAPILIAACGDGVAILQGEPAGTADQPSTEWTFRRVRLAP